MSADLYKRIRALEDELLEARQTIAAFKKDAEASHRPWPFSVSPYEGKILNLLMKRDLVTRNAIIMIIYNGEEPCANAIDTFMYRIRKKLAPYGVEITTSRGEGFCLTPEYKRRLDDVRTAVVQRAGAARTLTLVN
jgi:two-component system cell cycle response regulator CtrA